MATITEYISDDKDEDDPVKLPGTDLSTLPDLDPDYLNVTVLMEDTILKASKTKDPVQQAVLYALAAGIGYGYLRATPEEAE